MNIADMTRIPVANWATDELPLFNGRRWIDLTENDIKAWAQITGLDAATWLDKWQQGQKLKDHSAETRRKLAYLDQNLWQHQKDWINQFIDKPFGACFNDAGTGKTRMILEMLHLRATGRDGVKILYMCPINVFPGIEKTLADERYNYLSFKVLRGSSDEKTKGLFFNRNVYLVNYEAVLNRKFWAALDSRFFHAVILDEAHYIKTFDAARTKKIHKMAEKIGARFIMTATPGSEPIHSASLAYFLDLGRELGNPKDFKERYYIKNEWTKATELRQDRADEAKAAVQRFWSKHSHRVKIDDCLDMPKRHYITRYVELSAAEAKAYTTIEDEYLIEIGDDSQTITHHLAAMNYLRQAAGGGCNMIDTSVMAGHDEKPKRKFVRFGQSKLDELVKILDDYEGQQIVIAAAFRPEIRDISALLDKLGISYGGIYGGVPVPDRKVNLEKFMAGELQALILQSDSTAGIDGIQAGRVMVHYSKTWNSDNAEQLEGRIHRGGTTTDCTYITMISTINGKGLIDEYIHEILKHKILAKDEILAFVKKFVKGRKGK